MALSDFDRRLLERCLAQAPRSWEDFVDRFMGLVVHVANHTALSRSIRLSANDREDLVAEVFLAIVQNDFAVLRRFRGQSSLATYLAVVAHRVIVRKLLTDLSGESPVPDVAKAAQTNGGHTNGIEQRIADRDEIDAMLARLDGDEALVVRLFHLEHQSYQEISQATGLPVNSIGPLLSRARNKMRDSAAAD